MIADLAQIHPDKKAQIQEQAEDAVIFWLHERTQPQVVAFVERHQAHEAHRPCAPGRDAEVVENHEGQYSSERRDPVQCLVFSV